MIPIDPINGILRHVPGPYIADGSSLLPDANIAPLDSYTVQTDGGRDLGRVLLRYERKTARSGKHRHKFWSCVHAAQVDPARERPCVRIERIDAPF